MRNTSQAGTEARFMLKNRGAAAVAVCPPRSQAAAPGQRAGPAQTRTARTHQRVVCPPVTLRQPLPDLHEQRLQVAVNSTDEIIQFIVRIVD